MVLFRHCCGAILALSVACGYASEPLPWITSGRPTTQALQAVDLLAASRTHGLEPRDYEAAALASEVQRAVAGVPLGPDAAAALDSRLTAAMERYLADVHSGRVDPLQLPRGYTGSQRAAFDASAYLRRALQSGRLPEAARDAAPRLAQYERLREGLARYRTLVDHPAWKGQLPPLPAAGLRTPPKLQPGQSYPGLSTLRDRLEALGDLAPGTPGTSTYEGALVEAVRSFQERHGLDVDGVIGKATLAQLEIAPAARVRQIELMLERLRWTPLMQGPRMVVINIPEFVLRAYEVRDGRIVVQETMKIIVGKALNTRTPLFVEPMRYIEFQPYWNVPYSIARKEEVPRLRRDPGHFDRNGFEFVTSQGQVVTTLSPDMLDAVVDGRARLRQRPGPRNALGDIKFVFPNHENVYLHHTPAVQLFARDRRDFSHGCIRIERPVALATFVLKGMPGWDETHIRQAMSDGDPTTIRLAEPVPVVIAYGTAIVKGGHMYFYEDIYGQDRALDAALRQHRPGLTGS
jgi:murein L,D-transpeptidase YcbB/YkuD